MILCANCKLPKHIECRGLCVACNRYENRHGSPRPKRLWQRPIFCKLCWVKPARSNGLCHRCYEYDRINGKPRPLHLRNPDLATCLNPNCGKPLNAGRSRGAYCDACASYRWHHNNENRPERLCKNISTEGYRPCENPNCDKPVKIGSKRGRYCFPCLNYEIENGTDRPENLCAKRVA